MADKEHDQDGLNFSKQNEFTNSELNTIKVGSRGKKGKKDGSTIDKKGVCYLSRVPPHMNPVKLRQILSHYGEIERIYLTPEDPIAQIKRKKVGGFRGQEFSEGWVEFSKKTVAKKVANMLNGEQIGGKRRSSFYYDLWNIKYLSKFKWDDLTEEIAQKNAIREQKRALEISAAKRERDFYLSKVDLSCALTSMKERAQKKQKMEASDSKKSNVNTSKEPKVIRQFPQTRPVMDDSNKNKSKLSRDILTGVFASS